MHVMIRWKVKPDQVERELESLRAVYEDMRAIRPEGLRYATFQLDDGVTFVDVAEMTGGPGVLRQVAAFQDYRATLDERCDEPPAVTVLRQVGAYRFP
ncbi:hypothetical protein [Bailinhaonella thermotolerans]|uniref:Antibiotic biosynthesis monooxygenase n=1 Tax=Bailinhaonella thermotolerans TaxID=1070861 RepID=A0A3A4ARG6_9ACTN|nr:hypothetical protein [Bailinhaonella thermotolerans]RJL22045.1 hypothetical protein D5H75_36190 [Bailinhaonella thermotolerans]